MKKMNAMIQLLLTTGSQQLLKLFFNDFRHPMKFGEHVTIAYKPFLNDPIINRYREGDILSITVTGYASDDSGEAVEVEGVDSKNKHTHVTLSCADGISPVYSNDLLETEYIVENPNIDGEPLELTGIVKIHKF